MVIDRENLHQHAQKPFKYARARNEQREAEEKWTYQRHPETEQGRVGRGGNDSFVDAFDDPGYLPELLEELVADLHELRVGSFSGRCWD